MRVTPAGIGTRRPAAVKTLQTPASSLSDVIRVYPAQQIRLPGFIEPISPPLWIRVKKTLYFMQMLLPTPRVVLLPSSSRLRYGDIPSGTFLCIGDIPSGTFHRGHSSASGTFHRGHSSASGTFHRGHPIGDIPSGTFL